MSIGLVYDVVNLDTDCTEKCGSTIRTLARRTAGYRREYAWFRNGNYELRLAQTVENSNEELFPYHLRASENLRIAEMKCWAEQGGRNLVSPLRQILGLLPEHREIQRAVGRRNGRIGGRIQGRKNVQSGQLASISSKGGRIGGRINVLNKTGIFGRSIEKMSEDSRLGGRLGGRVAVQSGQLASIRSKGGRTVNHNHWHVARNISRPEICSLCRSAVSALAA